jgi:DNA-binding transcriptional MerR regulator
MNDVKNVFSIKDLENISGIKAHTIRIWEKRYNVLEPKRTDTNIRYYDLVGLQKLLNITLLHNHGYKISKISTYNEEKIPDLVKQIITRKSIKHHAISAFKMAMMNFDQHLFSRTYNELLLEKSFREIFNEIFVPLMNEIGLLWQTNTITVSHEHFISHLIKQKLLTNTEQIQLNRPTNEDKVFVMFLPMNEIHEMGLMYLNYEVIYHGYKSIFLGESVPIENLKEIKKYFDKIVFVTNLTVQPTKDEIYSYLQKVSKEVLIDSENELWVMGRMTEHINTNLLSENTTVFQSIAELVNKL